MAPYSFMLKFKNKIIIYLVIFVFCSAHSPWGSYLNYRAKHLLIMSVKTDAPTYPFSELLINYINKELPEAQSRPARAKDFESCLLYTSPSPRDGLLSRMPSSA